MDERFDLVDARFELIDKRFDGVSAEFHRIDSRFQNVEIDIRELRGDQVDAAEHALRLHDPRWNHRRLPGFLGLQSFNALREAFPA